MNPEDIENALRAAFLVAIPAATGRTEFENQPFTPPGDGAPWYCFAFMPNAPTVATLGRDGQDWFTGICQIDVHVAKGSGRGEAVPIIRDLRAAFTPSSPILYGPVAVTVNSCGQVPGGVSDNSYRFSVSIAWEARLFRAPSTLPAPTVLLAWGDDAEISP